MRTPNNVQFLEYACNCMEINKPRWDKLMKNATRADKNKINKLVKNHLPYLYNNLALNYPNPYSYYKTEEHLILVHSSIEYFLRYW